MEFQSWPKIARLNRDIIITEKIDGTNAAILIERVATHSERIMMPGPLLRGENEREQALWLAGATGVSAPISVVFHRGLDAWFTVQAQSRSRLIQPSSDNFGFAQWVEDHATDLVEALGAGRHFGEWWGSGIQRGYDQPKGLKHFSLFNTHAHRDVDLAFSVAGGISRVRPVPVLRQWGQLNSIVIQFELEQLALDGSKAAPGFMKPEGIIVFHTAAQTMFKATIENDAKPKGQS
jgi:hypothetical protein